MVVVGSFYCIVFGDNGLRDGYGFFKRKNKFPAEFVRLR